jgi:serine/threonine protein kinase
MDCGSQTFPFQYNVLITQSRRACIADFGLATAKDSKTIVASHHSTRKMGGTMRWQAPELSNPDETQYNTKASDIYAFACVCYEVRYQTNSVN